MFVNSKAIHAGCVANGVCRDQSGNLPMVYNGKSAKEWYMLYCHEVVRLSRIMEAAKEVVDTELSRVNENGDEPYDPIANPDQFDVRIVKLAKLLANISSRECS